MAVSAELMPLVLERIAAWQQQPNAPVACPHCGTSGLAIIDRSARPYAEWYAVSCAACGLDETIHIPLGPAVMGGYD